MKDQFIPNLFRSRMIALCHVCLFVEISIRGSREMPVFAPILFFGFWVIIFLRNVYSRFRENRLPWLAALRLVRAQRMVNEGRTVPVETQPEEGLGFCFDCATEGLQIAAQWKVAAGPNGEQKPVCIMHARAQALKNAAAVEEAKQKAIQEKAEK